MNCFPFFHLSHFPVSFTVLSPLQGATDWCHNNVKDVIFTSFKIIATPLAIIFSSCSPTFCCLFCWFVIVALLIFHSALLWFLLFNQQLDHASKTRFANMSCSSWHLVVSAQYELNVFLLLPLNQVMLGFVFFGMELTALMVLQLLSHMHT
jgi:hypothetical protein